MLDPRWLPLQHGPRTSLGKVDLRQRLMRLVPRASATPSPSNASERALIERLRRGEPEAVDLLYREQQRALRGYAQRLIGDAAAAEDLVHDVFVQLPELLGSFRAESSLRTYLLGVATHLARRYVDAASRRRKLLVRFGGADEVGPSPERAYTERQDLQRYQTALDSLPLRQRAAFVLCEVEERSVREVAEILSVPEATVRTRCFHARKRLQAHLSRRAR